MKLLFEPRDLWVGVYWDRKEFFAHADVITIYVCLLPTIVLRFRRYVHPKKERCCDACGWAGADCVCANGQHRHQPIITDLKHAAEVIEILKMDRFKDLCARLRGHAQKLWESKP